MKFILKPVVCILVLFFYGEMFAQSVDEIKKAEAARVLQSVQKYLADEPVTITAFKAQNSAGGLHDYYSDGDYWWPDSTNPTGPYIRKDGMSNPANFIAHRQALIDMSLRVAALTAAYSVSSDTVYALKAIKHLRAWFIADETKMNPHLSFAQAVKGRSKGRGVGIIDTIHLIEVCRSAEVLYEAGLLTVEDFNKLKAWFDEYLQWLFSHPNGVEEQIAKNNHGTCYTLQVAAFAHLTDNDTLLVWCKNRLQTKLIPEQMAADGSFPLELERTKPYSYSIFNLDQMVMIVQILSERFPELWSYQTDNGKSVRLAIEYMYPFIKNKKHWPLKPDVEYFDCFPVRQTALLFGGLAYKNNSYLQLWQSLEAEPEVREVIRNFPIRQPLLWLK